jgi:hypothetical protein
MNPEKSFCSQCGSPASLTARFCPKCGQAIGAMDAVRDGRTATQDPDRAIEWDFAFPLITNRFFLYDMIKVLFWTFLIFDGIMLTIFLVQDNADVVLPFLGVSGLILLGFMLTIVGITVLIFGNRFPTRFAVNPEGVFYQSQSGRAAKLNRAAIIIGLLARKPGAAGAGMLAASRESGGVDWEDVHKIREYPDQKVVSLMNSWRVVVRLYCTPDNYPRVLGLVRNYAAAGAIKREELNKEAAGRPSPVPRRALLSLLVLILCIAGLLCPFEFEYTLLWVALACMLATIWLPGLSRITGALALAALVFAAVAIFRLGTEVHDLIPRSVLQGAPMPAWGQHTGFDSLDSPEWIRFGVSAAGLAGLAILATIAVLGRLHRRKPAQ